MGKGAFKAWRSEYSHACFTHCQEFLPSPLFVPGPFAILFFQRGLCGIHWQNIRHMCRGSPLQQLREQFVVHSSSKLKQNWYTIAQIATPYPAKVNRLSHSGCKTSRQCYIQHLIPQKLTVFHTPGVKHHASVIYVIELTFSYKNKHDSPISLTG